MFILYLLCSNFLRKGNELQIAIRCTHCNLSLFYYPKEEFSKPGFLECLMVQRPASL
jgi:hypothetical protein